MKRRILSGIQPSGELHLGNYFGMMSRMIEYQEKNDLFCCIVNLHALTTIDDKSLLSKRELGRVSLSTYIFQDQIVICKVNALMSIEKTLVTN